MPKEPNVEHPAPKNARSPMKTWRILFLDSAGNIEKLKGAGKDAGYTVVGALTIEKAWAFLDGKDHADVIVCAAHLKEESMFGFLKGVRDSEVHRNAKFLILSLEPSAAGARLHRSTKSAGMALGADTYAIMPVFDPHELIALIKELQPSVPMLQQSATDAEKRRAE
jgi:DNA-binding response OmpR family regulator